MRDYDLLTGLLAYQLRLASAGTLAWYVQSLEASPGISLLDFLLEKRAIHTDDAKLLATLTDHVVQAHGGHAGAALQAFGGSDAAQEAFARAVMPTEQGEGAPRVASGDDHTVIADELPHGLPRQITPETAGRYTGGSEYARGGIGRILLVHDEQIGRDVILKELLPHRATSPADTTLSRVPPADSPGSPMRQSAAMIARFLQEAKITGQLEHPSIVPVYELGLRADGQLYYTMKLVRGNTLAEAIGACKTLDDRLALIRPFLDVCQAMAYAHAKGVIHRDLKPSNIMVGEFGECVVLDWGLAKTREGKDAHAKDMEKTMSHLRISPGELNAARTGTNDIVGTPLYMAPEQARGEVDTVTYHSDVFSLGVILYEMLTGFTPHRWTNTYDTVRRVATLPVPPVRKRAPQTPPELAAICDKALQFDEMDRYPSAKELAADLRRFLEGALVDAYAYGVRDQLLRLYRQHKPTVLATAGAAAAVLVIGVVAYVLVLRAWDNERAQRLVAENAEERALVSRDEAEDARDIAEQAKGEAEEALQLAQRQQYLAQIRLAQTHIEDQQMRLANEALEAAPVDERDWVWKYLYHEANADLFSVRSETSTIYIARYDPTGNQIVAIRSHDPPGLWNANDGAFIRDFEGDAQVYYSVCFSHDGTRFAAIGEGGVLDVWDIATGTRTLHSIYESRGLSVAFTNEASRIWAGYAGGTLVEWDIDVGDIARIIATGEDTFSVLRRSAEHDVMLSVHGLGDEPTGSITAWGISSGEELYTLNGTSIWVSPKGNSFVRAFDPSRNESGPSVVGVTTQNRNRSALALHSSLDGKLLREFEPETPVILDVAFDHDGQHFVSTSSDGMVRIYSVDLAAPLQEIESPIPALKAFPIWDGEAVLGCTPANQYIIWELESGLKLSGFAGENRYLLNADISPQRDRIVSSSGHHVFEVFDIQHLRTKQAFAWHEQRDEVPPKRVTEFSVSTNGRLAAAVWDYRTIRILDIETMEWIAQLEAEDDTVPRAVIAPDNEHVYFCRSANELALGSFATGSSTIVANVGAQISAFAVNATGEFVAIATENSDILVWNTLTGVRTYQIEMPSISRAIAYDSGDMRILAGCDDGHIRTYDTNSWSLNELLNANNSPIWGIAVDPKGKFIGTATLGGTVALWDATTGLQQHFFGMDEFTTPVVSERLGIRFAHNGEVFLVQLGELERTIVVDPRDGSVLSNLPIGFRLELFRDDESVLQVRQPGIAHRIKL